MKKSIILLMSLLATAIFSEASAQTSTAETTRIVRLGEDSVHFRTLSQDVVTKRLIILEQGDKTQHSSLLKLNLDSFPALETLELLNITYTQLSFEGKKRSQLKSLLISASPAFNLSSAMEFLASHSWLEQLSIDGAVTAEIPSSIKKIRSLNTLSISNCDVVDLAKVLDALQKNPGLDVLRISGNFEVRFPSKYICKQYYQKIDVSDNYLSNFPAWLVDPEGITYLDISGNDLSLSEVLYPIKNIAIDTVITSITTIADTAFVHRMFKESVCLYKYDTVTEPESVYISSAAATSYTKTANLEIDYRSFEAPVEEATVHFQQFTGVPAREQLIMTPTGTKITIPANAIVDAQGNTVQNNYQIYFRELSDPASIFLSGVPMTYDSGGSENIFETAGMFEIYAMQDTNMLQLRPGAEMEIKLATTSMQQDFNLYKYNDSLGNWTFAGNNANTLVKGGPEGLSRAWTLQFLLDNYPFDTNNFSSRYENLTYARTRRLTSYFWGDKKDLRPFFKVKKIRSNRENRDNILFRFPYIYAGAKKKYVISTANYKELTPYCNYNWQYIGPMSKQEFLTAYCKIKRWTDIRVEYSDASNRFTISLKSPQSEVSFEAVPQIPNVSEDSKLEKLYARLDVRYKKTLSKVESSFDRALDRKKIRDQKKDWKIIKSAMSQEELKMTQADWLAYARQTLALFEQSDTSYNTPSSKLTRTLQVSGFGIWNCDHIRNNPSKVNVLAELRDAEGKKVIPKQAWMVCNTGLGVFPAQIKENKVTYVFIPNEMMAMCVIDQYDKLYVTHYADCKSAIDANGSKIIGCKLLVNPDTESLHQAMGF